MGPAATSLHSRQALFVPFRRRFSSPSAGHSNKSNYSGMLRSLRGFAGAGGGRSTGRRGLSIVTNFDALVLLRLESEPKRTNSVPHRPMRQNRCAPPRRGRKKNQATTVSACNSAVLGFFFRPACASRRVVLVCNRRATQRFCEAPQAPKKPGLVREDLHFAWDSDHLRIPGRSLFVIV